MQDIQILFGVQFYQMEGELRLAKPADLLICFHQMCMNYIPVYSWILRSMQFFNNFFLLFDTQSTMNNSQTNFRSIWYLKDRLSELNVAVLEFKFLF